MSIYFDALEERSAIRAGKPYKLFVEEVHNG